MSEQEPWLDDDFDEYEWDGYEEQAEPIDVYWEVVTRDSDTGVADDEVGAIEVTAAQLANRKLLRELVIDDFEERGAMWDDWAYGDITEVLVEIDGKWEVLPP